MCGIVSLISRRTNGFFAADLDLFESLLVLDTLRGLDSTGVFSVDSNRNIGYMKVASHPYHLFSCEGWKKWRGKAIGQGRIIVGHNRKATQGSINSKNAHPFHENNIILVHNGTLRGDHKKMADTEVDSHALCHAFNEKGAENVIPTINGAFALMWWDIEKSRLYAIRNDERPLSIVITDELFVVLSEDWMARALLNRANKKVTDVIDIKPGLLYEFKIGGEYSTKEIEIQEPWSTVTTYRGGTQNSKTQGASGGEKTTALTLVKNSTSSPSSQQQGGNTEDDNPKIDPWQGHVPCAEYMKDMDVLVKLYEMKLSENKKFYFCRGKTIEPGAEPIDVVSFLPLAGLPDAHEPAAIRYTTAPVLAKIVKHTDTVCGRSLFVNNLRIPELMDTHNGRITEHEWNYVITNCVCQKCTAKIYDEEREFTYVSRRTGNKLVATCADCVQDTLTGEFKHAFEQNRLAALQAHERKCNEVTGSTLNNAAATSTPTIH